MYRWEKRRARKRARASLSQINVFDLIFLILTFTIGLLLFHILREMAFKVSVCAEQIANYGAGHNSPPAYKRIFYISILMIVFWFVLFFAHSRKMKSLSTKIFRGFTLTSILLTAFLSYHMSIWDNPDKPDGTLAVADGVWATANGQRVWKTVPLYPLPWKDYKGLTIYEPQYRLQRCVWLDDGLISVGDDPFVGDYDLYTKQLKQKWENDEFPQRSAMFWEQPTIKDLWAAAFNRESWLQALRDRELVRPLTNEDRARFKEKQRCLNTAYDPSSGKHPRSYQEVVELCDPMEYPPWPTGY